LITLLARRLFVGAIVILLVSFGTFWFFATNFYGPAYGGGVFALWWSWLRGLWSGRSFGHVFSGTSVPQLGPALAHTVVLLGATLLLVLVLSVLLATFAAAKAGSAIDVALRISSYAAWSVPAFLLALIAQTVFAWLDRSAGIHPFPLFGWAGYCPPAISGGFFNGPCSAGSGLGYAGSVARHVVLPAAVLATSFIGLHSRHLRSSMLVALRSPYTTTARAKGLPERQVVLRHALRNSLATFVSSLLLDFASLFGAALAVDWVFKLGGLGTLFITEIADPLIDPNQVTSLLFITALLVLASSLLSDIVVGMLDPRIRLR
jgi:peptide/nickel transport system permease protein